MTITGNVHWNIQHKASWLAIDPLAGEGALLVSCSAGSNSTGSPRIAELTLSSSGLEDIQVVVYQQGSGLVSTPGQVDAHEEDVQILLRQGTLLLGTNTNALIRVALYNLQGVQVYNSSFHHQADIALNSFPAGSYIVVVQTSGSTILRKIILP